MVAIDGVAAVGDGVLDVATGAGAAEGVVAQPLSNRNAAATITTR